MTPRDRNLIHRVSRWLKSCREAAGYESARAFYEASGGRTALRCSYATYRRLEETDRLPKPETFARIYGELENSCAPTQLRELARAYARAFLGEEIAAWSWEGNSSDSRRGASLRASPANLWGDILADPRMLTAVFALEGGRVFPDDLPGPLPQARRSLERLARAGLARLRNRAYVPIARAFPIARSWAPTTRAREDFERRLFCASGGTADVVGGIREFVRSDRDDMDEFFQHLQKQAARQTQEARAGAGRAAVYLLEVLIQERLCIPEDAMESTQRRRGL